MLGGNNNNRRGNAAGTSDQTISTVEIVMLLDRFLSASTASDVIESLQGIERGLKQSSSGGSASSKSELAWAIVSPSSADHHGADPAESSSSDDYAILNAFWKLLHREHAKVQDEDNAQEGVLCTCRILSLMLNHASSASTTNSSEPQKSGSASGENKRMAKTLLEKPAEGRILEALMDVVVAHDDSNHNNGDAPTLATTTPYIRVLACQILHRLCTLQPSLAQAQLLRAPNGLHRLGDLLQVHIDEQVRNETLLLAATLAQWPAVAQVWIFSGLPDTLLELAISGEDAGLTRGPVLVQDVLHILKNLVTQTANNPNIAELLLTSSQPPERFGQRMAALLDLRQGQHFLHPQEAAAAQQQEQSSSQQQSKTKKKKKQSTTDDLDDLIQSASTVKKSSSSGTMSSSSSQNTTQDEREPAVVPRLLASEEVILRTLLDIWLTLLQDKEKVQEIAWRQHQMVLRMIWEMALLSPPPTPYTPYPCAIPSVELQQYALHVVAQSMAFCLNDISMARDRLLYLVCTGGLGRTRSEKYQLSQAALHVLRQAAPQILTTEMMLFALTPPPEEGAETPEEQQQQQLPPDAQVVPKLLSTVQQHLILPPPREDGKPPEGETDEDHDMHVIGLVGSVGALSLFLRDDVSRSMLLKLVLHDQQEAMGTDDTAVMFVDQLLERLEHAMEKSSFQVAACLLRFLATWCTSTPEVVYAIMSSSRATILSNLYLNSPSGTDKNFEIAIAQLAGLVLGICLANLRDETQAAGWTKDTLMQILTRKQLLQQNDKNSVDTSLATAATSSTSLPWSHSEWECKVYRDWKRSTLLMARQAMVQFLTTQGGDEANDDDGSLKSSRSQENKDAADTTESSDTEPRASNKALAQMMAQQTAELESLRAELEQAKADNGTKDKQLAIFRLRVESTPTELDKLVEDTTEQNRRLQQDIEKWQKADEEAEAKLAKVQGQVKTVQGERDEALQEVETLRQDMESLTQAYSSLESELQRQQQELESYKQQQQQQQQNISQAAASSTSEGNADGAMDASVSTQVATLRAENARYREDAKAKDNWMQMAVDRFKVLDEEKAGLQQRIATMESGNEGQSAWNNEREQLQQEHNTKLQTLQQEQRASLHSIQQEHETSMQSLQQEHANAVQSLQNQLQEQLDESSKYQAQIEAVRDELDIALATQEKMRKDHDLQIKHLRQEKDAAQAAEAVAHVSESEANELQELKERLAALQTEFQETTNHKDTEIYQHESTIRELQSRLDSDLGSYSVEDIRTRDEEIAQLRESNDAAQDWMAKAVEHHNMLSEQVASLTNENTALKTEIKELKDKLLPMETSNLLAEKLQAEVEEKTEAFASLEKAHEHQIKEIENAYASRIGETEVKHSGEMKALKEQIADLSNELQNATAASSSVDEVNALRTELSEKSAQINDLLKEHEQLNEANSRLFDLDMEVVELRAELKDATEDNETLVAKTHELETALQESQTRSTSSDPAKEALIQQLEEEKDRLNEQLAEDSTTKNREVQELTAKWDFRCASLEEQVRDLEQRCLEAESRVPSSGAELDTQSAGERRSESDDDLEDLKAQVTSLREELETQEKEASNCVAQWQESYSAMEARCTELQRQLEETKASSVSNVQGSSSVDGNGDLQRRVTEMQQQMEERERQTTDVIGQWQKSYEYLQQQNTDLLEQVDGLKNQLEHPQGGLTEPSNDLEVKCRQLEQEVENYKNKVADNEADYQEITTLKDKITSMESQLNESNDATANLEEKCKAAMAEKTAMQTQLDTMSQEYDDMLSNEDEQRKKLSALERKLTDMQGSLAATEEQAVSHSERVTQLEEELAAKTAELEGEESEADQVVQQWQESYEALSSEKADLDERFGTLSMQVQTLTSERDRYLSQLGELQMKLPVLESEKAELEKTTSRVADLEAQLANKEEQIRNIAAEESGAVRTWQERNKQLQEELSSLKSRMDGISTALEEARHKKEQDKSTIVELEKAIKEREGDKEHLDEALERVATLEAELREAEEQYAADSQEAEDVIDQWKESYETLEASKGEFEERIKSLQEEQDQILASRDEFMAMAAQLESDLREAQSALDTEKVGKLEEEISNLSAERDTVVTEKDKLVTRVGELEQELSTKERDILDKDDRITELTTELEVKEDELTKEAENADDVISQWEESYNSVVAEKAEVDASLESFLKEIDALKTTNEERTEETSTLKADLESVREELKHTADRVAGLEEELAEAKASSKSASEEVQEKISSLEADLESMTEEKDSALAQVEDLEEKLEAQRISHKQVDDDASELKEELVSAKEALVAKCEKLEADLKDKIEEAQKETSVLQDEVQGLQEQLKSRYAEENDLKAKLATVEADKDELSKINSDLVSQTKQLESDLSEKAEVEEDKARLETRLDVITQERDDLLTCRAEVERLKSELENDKLLQEGEEERMNELQVLLDEANQRLEKASAKERKLQDKCKKAEELSTKLASGIDQARAEALEKEGLLVAEVTELKASVASTQSSCQEQLARVSELEEALDAEIQQADEAIQQWQDSYDSLLAEKEELEAQLAASEGASAPAPPPPPPDDMQMQERLKQTEDDLTERNAEYMELMNSYEETLKLYDELEIVKTSLEERVSRLESEAEKSNGNSPVVPAHEDENKTSPPTTSSVDMQALQSELKVEREGRKAEQDRCTKFELELETQKAESEKLVESWKGEAEEFERLLQEQQKASGAEIEKLRARCDELEQNKSSDPPTDVVTRDSYEKEVAVRKVAEEEVLALKVKLDESKVEASNVTKKLQQTEEMLTSRLETALTEQERERLDRDAQHTAEQERYEVLEREFETMRARLASLEQERDTLQVRITDLEGELKEASDELQHYLTNEISEQATKLAADALRRQIDDMRQQAEVDMSAFNAERSARLTAEQESKRLHADLAALLGLENIEENQNEIRRRTAEATEYFQRNEKAEINALKDSLAKAMKELESTRILLKEAEETVDSAELKSGQLEQDLTIAKSDLKLLTHMMEEMREAESSRRAAMENRISAFEDERNVLLRQHEAEVENMRNELEQVVMERDSMGQSLKESEKRGEALMQASTRGRGSGTGEDPSSELVRLRMEKAHLLAAASQEAARTERRIRELREAAMSSAEADLLVERELRTAAQLALENATAELRVAQSSGRNPAASQGSGARLHDLEIQVKKLKDHVETLEGEKKSLEKKITDSSRNSKETIDRLKEECRAAKAKALQLERASRRDAEVRAEVARLQVGSSVEEKSADGQSAFGESKHIDDAQISNLYDLIEQQRQTIEDQREAHTSLETDFEGLLALLAQGKLVEESLSSALSQSCGEKAVRDAIVLAEERAVSQYGSFVRVSE